MKKIENACIIQTVSFDSEDEKRAWISKISGKAERKFQHNVIIMSEYINDDNRICVQVAKPYNQSPMPNISGIEV